MDDLIPNNIIHVNGGKDLNIATGIPCKIINDGHYLDNGGEESKNYGEYRISSDRNYLDTFGGGHESEVRVSSRNHNDNSDLSKQLWTFSTQMISETKEVQIQSLSNKCYLDNWGRYSAVHFNKYLSKPSDPVCSRQLWKFEIADYKFKVDIENFKMIKKSIIFISRNLS
ncbi:hypothetical protein C2G38_2198792 [Gigaspora rosea]|uniref:Uncharacterized protein n=1 Tax=Gigaspora rosea TaxID=44941 RepID=A0A397USC5_9GLOM|nr:hypothetical protein C2G38_2198792 [Gigaspora rosea]